MAEKAKENEINITYETLYELLRREKNREELQEFSQDFFRDLVSYIESKEEIIKSGEGSDMLSASQQQKNKIQLENIRKILKELYEKRERKIINMALTKSRTGSDIIDMSRLLGEEKMLYDELKGLLDRFRSGILANIVRGKLPKVDAVQEFAAKGKEDAAKPAEKKPEEAKKSTALIRFLQPVPKFLGKELETYGPFDKDEIATLPSEIASVLITKQRAEEIEQE